MNKKILDEITIIDLYKEKSILAISKIMKCDFSVIKRILIKNNICLRNHKDSIKKTMSDKSIRNKLKDSFKKSIEKRKSTCLKKYGVEYASQSKQFQDKIKVTSLQKYGVSHFLQNTLINKKRESTCFEKYNVSNVSKVIDVKNKIKDTNLSRRDVECPFQDINVKKKIKDTIFKKYGVEFISQSKDIQNKKNDNRISKILPTIILNLKNLNLELISEFYRSGDIIKVKCLKCNNIFETTYFNLQQNCMKCRICHPILNRISKAENEISDFILNDLNIESIRNDKQVINPFELDIYIPSMKIAFEYNGLYWHSDLITKDKFYHLNKTEECEKNGIQLVHIFEDEWFNKKEIVKNRIKVLLNKFEGNKIYARNCEIKEIPSFIKNEFLDKYHIQGSDISSINLGAFYNLELVSVMTFSYGNISKGSKKINNVFELNRFCLNYNYHVIGIASKFLEFFKKNYLWEQIYSYCDRRWSLGKVYHKIGFNLDSITKPNYWYILNNKRIHRFNLRKKPDEPKNIPEWILRSNEGYYRIWDCGNLKFTLSNNLLEEKR